MNSSSAKILTAFISISLGVVWSGCSKKDSVAPAVPAADTSATGQPTPAAAPTAAPPTARDAGSSSTLTDAQAAIKAKDYEKAASVMVNLQRQPLTQEQAQAVRGQMVQFQRDLAAGIAAGDPKAKAAAELLRQSAMR